MFPTTRLRRLRYHPAVRELVRETRLSPANLILPLFVRPGEGVRRADRLHARPLPVVARYAGRRGQSGGGIGPGRRDPLRHPRQEGRPGQRRHERLGHYRPGRPRGEAGGRATSWSSPTSAAASTPTTATAAPSAARPAGWTWRTTPRWNFWPSRRWSTPGPAPTWSPPAA